MCERERVCARELERERERERARERERVRGSVLNLQRARVAVAWVAGERAPRVGKERAPRVGGERAPRVKKGLQGPAAGPSGDCSGTSPAQTPVFAIWGSPTLQPARASIFSLCSMFYTLDIRVRENLEAHSVHEYGSYQIFCDQRFMAHAFFFMFYGSLMFYLLEFGVEG